VREHGDRLGAADGVDVKDTEQAAQARMLGCGNPPNSRCGGDATAIDATPASWAGTRFMITLDASGASPPGT
jgi:hypothetical protein